MFAKRMIAPNQLDLALNLSRKKTRKRVFYDEISRVMPWSALVTLIEHHALRARPDHSPYAIETMLSVHLVQQFFSLSDLAMQDALHEMPCRKFASLDGAGVRLPGKSTILQFRYVLEAHDLEIKFLGAVNSILTLRKPNAAPGTTLDATLIAAPSSSKKKDGKLDPEVHQMKKRNQRHLKINTHIGVDADSSLVHTVVGTAANVNNRTYWHKLLYGNKEAVFANAGYRGDIKREHATGVRLQVAIRPRRSGVPVSNNQALARFYDGALPRTLKKQGADNNKGFVRAAPSVNGKKTNFSASIGMNATVVLPMEKTGQQIATAGWALAKKHHK